MSFPNFGGVVEYGQQKNPRVTFELIVDGILIRSMAFTKGRLVDIRDVVRYKDLDAAEDPGKLLIDSIDAIAADLQDKMARAIGDD